MDTSTSTPMDANNVVPPPVMNTDTSPPMPNPSPTWKQSFVDRNKKLLIIIGSLVGLLLLMMGVAVWRWRSRAVGLVAPLAQQKLLQKTAQQRSAQTTPAFVQTPFVSPSIQATPRQQQSKQGTQSLRSYAVPTKAVMPVSTTPAQSKKQQVVASQKHQQTQQRQQIRYRPPLQFALHPGPYQEKIAKVINPDQFAVLPKSNFLVKKTAR